MQKANDRQVAGNHYRKNNIIQHWDFAAAQNFDYFQGQVTKYVTRWKDKNGVADLEKALHFLEKYIEVEKTKIQIADAGKMTSIFKRDRIDQLPTSGKITIGPVSTRNPPTTYSGQENPFGFDAKED